jgi:hypothetical protein
LNISGNGRRTRRGKHHEYGVRIGVERDCAEAQFQQFPLSGGMDAVFDFVGRITFMSHFCYLKIIYVTQCFILFSLPSHVPNSPSALGNYK